MHSEHKPEKEQNLSYKEDLNRNKILIILKVSRIQCKITHIKNQLELRDIQKIKMEISELKNTPNKTKKLTGWAQQQNINDRGRISKPAD